MAEQTIWGIHTTHDYGNTLFLEKNSIAIGWPEIGNLGAIGADRDSFKAKIAANSPGKSAAYIGITTGQLFRFTREMKVGDLVVYRATYFDGLVHIGRVAGEYRYEPSVNSELPNMRDVQWLKAVSPTSFTQGALYEMGAAMTLFQIKNYADEYKPILEGHAQPPLVSPDEDETVGQVVEDIEQNTADFIIKELQRHLKGHDLQGFVADVLRTMGYQTAEAKEGPDGGVDIVAYKDELRLLPPIVKVQVKSGDSNIGRDTVQSLVGNLGNGEYGLFVTVGGFTKQALDYGRTRNNIRLIDGPALVRLVLERYEQLQPQYKALIPLQRVYVPQPVSANA